MCLQKGEKAEEAIFMTLPGLGCESESYVLSAVCRDLHFALRTEGVYFVPAATPRESVFQALGGAPAITAEPDGYLPPSINVPEKSTKERPKLAHGLLPCTAPPHWLPTGFSRPGEGQGASGRSLL